MKRFKNLRDAHHWVHNAYKALYIFDDEYGDGYVVVDETTRAELEDSGLVPIW